MRAQFYINSRGCSREIHTIQWLSCHCAFALYGLNTILPRDSRWRNAGAKQERFSSDCIWPLT